jgi:hypothetical protein
MCEYGEKAAGNGPMAEKRAVRHHLLKAKGYEDCPPQFRTEEEDIKYA